MKWKCSQCDYETSINPRKGKQKVHCPICRGRIAWLRMFDQCPCGNWFHPDHYGVKTCSKICRYTYCKKGGKLGRKYPHLQRSPTKKCLQCGKDFRAIHDQNGRFGGKRFYKQKYCSIKCKEKAWKIKIRPTIVLPPPLRNEQKPFWKGEDAGYSAKHLWIKRLKGTPRICDHCHSKKKRKYEWCNVDHKYRRDVEDWMRLCTSCHRTYDIQNLGTPCFGK